MAAALADRLPARARGLLLPWNVNLVCLMGFLGTLAGTALYIVLTNEPLLRGRFHADFTTLGLAGAVGSGATILTTPLWGTASDRWGRKRVVLLGAAAGPPVTLWLLAVHSGPELLFRSFVAGLLGGSGVASTALVADSAREHQRARSMSFTGVAFAAGAGGGFLAGLALYGRLGFEGMVAAMAGLTALPALLALALREVSHGAPVRSFLGHLKEALGVPQLRVLFLVTLSVVFPLGGIGVALLPFLRAAPPAGLGLADGQILATMGVAGGLGFLVFLVSAWRTDKTLRRRSYILTGALLAGFPFLLFPFAGGFAGFLALAVAVALGVAVAGPAIGGLLVDIMPPEHRGSGFGLLSFALSLSFIGSAPLGGFLYDRLGFAAAFYGLALAAIPGEVLALKRRALLMPT